MIDDDEGAAFLFAGGGHKNSDDGSNFDISPAAAAVAAFDCGDLAATTTTLFAVLVPGQLGNGTCLGGAFRVYPFFRFDTPVLNVMLLLLMEGSSLYSDRIGENLESDV